MDRVVVVYSFGASHDGWRYVFKLNRRGVYYNVYVGCCGHAR